MKLNQIKCKTNLKEEIHNAILKQINGKQLKNIINNINQTHTLKSGSCSGSCSGSGCVSSKSNKKSSISSGYPIPPQIEKWLFDVGQFATNHNIPNLPDLYNSVGLNCPYVIEIHNPMLNNWHLIFIPYNLSNISIMYNNILEEVRKSQSISPYDFSDTHSFYRGKY